MPYICVQPTVDHIGFARTVGVVWVCRRFEYSHFCRRFGVAVVTCRRFDHRPTLIGRWIPLKNDGVILQSSNILLTL